jgi:hypothetical protein
MILFVLILFLSFCTSELQAAMKQNAATSLAGSLALLLLMPALMLSASNLALSATSESLASNKIAR